MNTEKEMITNFIDALFEPDSPWDKIAQYVEGKGEFVHPILNIATIYDLHYGLIDFRKSFPDMTQIVKLVGVLENGNLIAKTFASATFKEDLANFKVNGKHWCIPVYWEFELNNGKIKIASELANHHAINNQLGLALFKAPFELE
ncbi:hypothetical protein [Rickettsia helvetica]|uniref:Restriction endonuclease n=1 Tax=Rickettsia helvetica TaxID=35789 RepID=A0ABP0T504_RICHE|nr:hypothetical protein [Rickettsia helvetica]MCZ6884146.1 hypothetical protein [Rickettsia endosymbiont of Ixodes ricinus]MCZ6897050.1 hypothetical protein [Rickettsia endosymbiont of Ixodes ricinus]